MNLIEQFGGYEKAKNEMNRLNNSDYAVDHSYAHEIEQALVLYVRQLEQDVLQCRNQHTIFEPEDGVSLVGMREQFEKLPEIAIKLIAVNFNEMRNKYESKSPVLIECFEAALYINGAWYAYQEVKATRRPELDSDTCSDIRNHVSPLTKVIDR